MSTYQNGIANGVNGHGASTHPARFSDVPKAISVAVAEEEEGPIEVEISLDDDIQDDPTELCTLLENENTPKNMWMVVALGYAKHGKLDVAVEVLTKALGALQRGRPDDRLSVLNALCWMYLLKCREAPRIKPDNQLASEARTKDFYIQAATSTLNDASRISPSYPPLFLARGVLYLLRSSLQSSKSGSAAQITSERNETLKQALKCFEDALRASGQKNIMALMGKARVQYSLGRYPEALKIYQDVLNRAPDVIDPDPRIGIGCCFWQLGHKDDAQRAWERSLELNPKSKIALILLGLYNLHLSSQYSTSDPQFPEIYKKAIMEYAVPAFKTDNKLPLACATLGNYYISRKMMGQAEPLARRAIELTDVNAIASDGWYLLARKEHYNDDIAKASDYYSKSDQARGGDERGYIPAKLGSAQIRVLMQDYDGAKFRLEKILQQSKITEAQTLLGSLYAEDVFSQSTKSKEDKANEMKKALSHLEAVRMAWADPKKKVSADSSVLLNLARLYEIDQPDKSLKCLEQAEQIELDLIDDGDKPQGIEDEAEYKAVLRESLPPQLLNNMGCFHYQSEKFGRAREHFQTALNACVKAGDKDQSIDTDALVTTISYNLARTYEAEGMSDEAKRVYEGLLDRHSDYTDAVTRLAYIALRQSPSDEGPKAIQKLYRDEPGNLEVRALYGWYLSKAKKRTMNFSEDQEQRHYKHTLQSFDKHDRYSLTGMGNVYLTIAREMRRDTEQDKEKRRKMYERAVEIFDKALQLDPQNAYAAQGIAIALVEDKKDYNTALQIFSKVRETMKEASVFVNLGHTYCEVKQYARAIENYEAALLKDRARDPQILACLGRVWLLRGKHDKNIKAMKTSLEYSQRALEVASEQVHFKFNVAFVQFQIAQLIINLSESQRTLEEVEAAGAGLDEAIESFSAIALSPSPPFPKHDIEQRANMGRNTMRRQLERTLQQQREYEQKNADRLQQARDVRDAEIRKREEEKRKVNEAILEQKRKIAEERQKMEERDREYIEKRKEEEKRRQEFIAQDEVRKGERGKGRRGGGKRKKKGEASDSDTEGGDSDAGARRSRQRSALTSATPDTGDERPRQKKRKLERKSKISSKFKSDEVIVDSGSEDDGETAGGSGRAGSDQEQPAARTRKTARIIDDDDDDEDDGGATKPNGDAASDEDEEMAEAPSSPTENGGNVGGDSESE